MHYGFLVDLSQYTLDETSNVSWIQAMPYGTWEHPMHGTISLNAERAQRFAANVNNNIRGQELDIDYDHKEKSNEAAGWVKKAEAREDGLWLAIDWTKKAAELIREKAYRYFSPEFVDEWKHPSLGETFKDVLFGGGLTNRPFLKGILPINLSEVMDQNEGGKVDKLREKLGLPETATEDEVLAKVEELQTPDKSAEDGTQEGTPTQESVEDGAGGAATTVTQASETVKLSDGSVVTLSELESRIAATETALRLSEVNAQVVQLNEGTRKLPPVVLDELKSVMMSTPKALSDRLVKLFSDTLSKGLVELGERGSTRPDEASTSATKRFTDAIEKVMDTKKLSYADAVIQVSNEHPELAASYTAEVRGLQEV